MNISDSRTLSLIGVVLVLLGIAWAIVKVLKRRPESGIDPAILETFRLRVRAWWILFAMLAAAFLLGHWTTVVLFGLISFWALREFITLTPTRPGDHRTLFWVFFLFTPLQFVLVGMGLLRTVQHRDPGLRLPLHSRAHRHGRRLQAVPGADGEDPVRAADLRLLPELRAGAVDAEAARCQRQPDVGGNARLLFFFVLIVQLSDALQYAWSQIPSKHVIVPTINPTRTWEGLLGGTASVTLDRRRAVVGHALPRRQLVDGGRDVGGDRR